MGGEGGRGVRGEGGREGNETGHYYRRSRNFYVKNIS